MRVFNCKHIDVIYNSWGLTGDGQCHGQYDYDMNLDGDIGRCSERSQQRARAQYQQFSAPGCHFAGRTAGGSI